MSGQHVYRTGNQWGVTVRELINKVAEEGLPVRLNWPDASTEPPLRVSRHTVCTDYPTGVLPATILRALDELAPSHDWDVSA